MPLKYDPEFAKVAGPILEAVSSTPKPPSNDVQALAASIHSSYDSVMATIPALPDIEETIYTTTSYDGHPVPIIRIALKQSNAPSSPGPAIVHAHFGGFVAGSAQKWSRMHHGPVLATGIPFFAVGYRLATEKPFPAAAEDVYAAVKWLQDHATELNVDPARIATMGISSGGNLAAAVALMARDRGLSPPLAKQILIYPALDNRNTTPNPDIEPFSTWTCDNNVTAWNAYLGGVEKNEVSPYAAPARATRFDGLPPAYIDVGGVDMFRDESVAYAAEIMKAGINVELHVYPGVPHGFEAFGPGTGVCDRAQANRLAAMKDL
ncbi:Alpha/Beta hydrolase protein [Aspergillus heterothallicus]